MIMTQDEIKSYLKRIGIADIEAPTLPYLIKLHKAHVSRITWQTIDIFAGQPASIDVRESVQLMINGRSGYCFHLNGAFCTLLRSLGYRVSMHRAGVQPLGETPRINSFHLGLIVTLENEANEEEPWIIDAGLGDLPYEPIPLKPGVYAQGPFTYKVVPSGVAERGWRLEHDPRASFTGVDYAPEVVEDIAVFHPKHEHYSRSADSPWIGLFLIRNRMANESNELRGCVWSKQDGGGITKTELQTKSQWLAVLDEVFGEHLVRYSDLEKDALWQKVRQKHEEWLRKKELSQRD
ncbi:arylamine N-acetyltransferase [Paenibacillus allorhizosphaerae]|uniref:Arylamine N-acetyltransferase n=1 Tax=Paenibacillus allorhizosphaerae TaxID=2849866 RepID=A0ABM8VI02_9BACL|nr:arylamine N-acetyltransferase [Paenibacillus allorhizosphaerae]CAG7643365.1 hypothetical protein PAECIP111802_03002 [Paenibacillus allorhizosphaerae]